MIIDILTLFPEMFDGIISSSIIKRSIEKGIVSINVHNFRDYTLDKNKRVDDYSYGGGAGMIIQVQPVLDCLKSINGWQSAKKLITNPVGVTYNQNKAKELAEEKHIIIVCGHYEGIDDRINNYIDQAISIGDYILTGGEIASLAIIDSVVRLLPDALGNSESTVNESFEGLLEYPQYTRPLEYDGNKVPEILISGNHEKVRKYRRFQSLKITLTLRPDMLETIELTKEDHKFLEMIKKGEELWRDY